MTNEWKKQEEESDREKQPGKKVCVWKSLNSYLPCMCQMALCTVLLHNQNSESHFRAHTHSYIHTDRRKQSKTKCHQGQTFINQILQSGTDTKTFSSTWLKMSSLPQTNTHPHCFSMSMPTQTTAVWSVYDTACVWGILWHTGDNKNTTATTMPPHQRHVCDDRDTEQTLHQSADVFTDNDTHRHNRVGSSN